VWSGEGDNQPPVSVGGLELQALAPGSKEQQEEETSD
jgi:hypothetical protein